jgi:hypothetical protein
MVMRATADDVHPPFASIQMTKCSPHPRSMTNVNESSLLFERIAAKTCFCRSRGARLSQSEGKAFTPTAVAKTHFRSRLRRILGSATAPF